MPLKVKKRLLQSETSSISLPGAKKTMNKKKKLKLTSRRLDAEVSDQRINRDASIRYTRSVLGQIH